MICVCVYVCVCYLCIPEHVIQSVMPRLMEAQSGPGSPQSQHWLFPGKACTSSRALQSFCSPNPKFTLLADTELQRSLCHKHKHTCTKALVTQKPEQIWLHITMNLVTKDCLSQIMNQLQLHGNKLIFTNLLFTRHFQSIQQAIQLRGKYISVKLS